MLPLLRHRLILAALLATAATGHAQDSAATWSWGVGQAMEGFHWHETNADEWFRVTGVDAYGRDVYDVISRGQRLFLQEDGVRHNTFLKVRGEMVPGLYLRGRVGYTYADVDYDGGLQPANAASAKTWPMDSAVIDGETYYRYGRVAFTSVTGYFGPDLDLGVELRPRARVGQFYPRGELAWCYSRLRRQIADGSSRAGGYDEVWTRSWVRLGAGAGWSTVEGQLLGGFGLRFPLSTELGIEPVKGGAAVFATTLKPQARTAWEATLAWESRFGLDLGLRYSRQIFDASAIVSGYAQPRSYEGVLRFEAGWSF